MESSLTPQEKAAAVKKYLGGIQLDGTVMSSTLGMNTTSVSPQVVLNASKKLLEIYSGKAEEDDRDNLKFSHFLGPEDFLKEHIDLDAGKIQLKAKNKLRQKRNLSWLHSGFFSPQLRSVYVGNSLAQNIEGVNPIEQFSLAHRVTKMGPGSITSVDAIPDSARNVHESQFGLQDPIATAESMTIGVVNFFADDLRKGDDGKVYKKVIDNKTGKEVWIDHQTYLNSKIDIPNY